MTEKRFDIVVQDKVAKTIRTELAAIGAAARTARNDLNGLTTAMGARAQSAAAQAQAAATRTAAATARVSAEQQRAALHAIKLAEAQSRANTAYLNEEAALNRAVAAEQRAIASKQRLEQATTSAAAAQQRSINITGPAAIPSSGTNYPFGQYAGDRNLAAKQTEQMRNMASERVPPIVNPQTVATATAAATAIRGVGNASKLSSQEMFQLYANTNDFIVQLSSGQSPMTAFIQQGAQMSQIPMQSGRSWRQFGSALAETLGLVKRTGDAALDAAAAQAAAAATAIASADAQAIANVAAAETEVALASAQQRAAVTANEQTAASTRLTAANQRLAAANAEAAVTSNALAGAQGRSAAASSAASASTVRSLSGMARGGLIAAGVLAVAALAIGGLVREANQGQTGLRRFTTEMGYTAKEVEELNSVTVGFGDTAKAVFQVGMERVLGAFGISMDDMTRWFGAALDWMASAARTVMAGIYATVAGTAMAMARIWKGATQPGSVELSDITGAYSEAYGDAQQFFDDVVSQARTNARGRQNAMASEMRSPGSDRGGRSGRDRASGWNRAEELRKANQELDIQIGMLNLYGDELERAQQIEQIRRQFRENDADLTAAEVTALEAKITTLQEGRRVQEAMTAAEEAANGPARRYEATQEALNRLLNAGRISWEDYTAQMRLATRAFDDATDPLRALNRELENNGRLVGLYGRDRDVQSYIQQLEQAAEAQGRSIYEEAPRPTGELGADGAIVVNGNRRRMTDEARGMVDEYRRQQQQGDYAQAFEAIDPRQRERPGDNSYILDHHRELYAEIDRLRQEDVISEEEAVQRKQNLDRAYLDARLEATSSVLGQLASLQNSNNKTVAKIGKAAAIAQTTIDGVRAVQAALAGPPGPPWSFAIAGVTAAMTAANVAKIAGIGFMTGGYTGDGARDQVAGVVHAGEYVFDAASTRRIGVPALEAIAAGRTLGSGQATGGAGMVNHTVSVGQISVSVQGKQDDPERTGIEVERGITRALHRIARKEIAEQKRDGGLLDDNVMSR